MGILQMVMSAVAAALDSYNLKRSTRFNPDDSAWLNRTPSSAGNRKTWTLSCWVKRTDFGAYTNIIGCHGANNNDGYVTIGFDNNDAFLWSGYTSNPLVSEQKFRDPAAWMHMVVSVDTTNATADNRIRLYVNGSEVTEFSTRNNPSPSQDLAINMTALHQIGGSGNSMFNGCLADIYLVDGLQLDATSFAKTDATTGQWIPKEYTHVASPNDGTTWSDGKSAQTGSASHPIEKIFDGDISTYGMTANSNGDSSDLVVTLPGLSSGKTVRFYGYRNTNAGTVTFNSGAVSLPTLSANAAWVTATNTTNGSSDSFSMNVNTGSSSSDDLSIYAIEVDGKVLIDGAVDNSFHLAMDPAESGRIYSNNLEVSSGDTSNPQNAFDGGISGECNSYDSNGSPLLTFTPSPAISYSSKVEIYLDRQNYAQINGGGFTQYAADAWHELATGIGTITTIDTKFGSNSGGHASLSAVRVDGKILTDHTSIGHDSSGNNNHWHENNLVVGGTTKWSDNVTGGRPDQPATNIFDGDITTYAQNTSGGPNPNTMPITFPSLSYSDKVEVLPNNVSSCAINGGSQTSLINGTWNTMDTGGGILTNLTFSRSHTNGCAVSAIRVDGIILTDPQHSDLLADVPGAPYDNGLNGGGNYATLNPLQKGSNVTLSNGNLRMDTSGATGNTVVSTIGVTSGKWYVEFICDSDQVNVGIANSPVLDNNYFSQASGSYSYYSANGKSYTGGSPATYGNSYGTGDVIGIAFDADNGSLYFYKNGVVQNSGTAAFTGLTSGPYFIAGGEGSSAGQDGDWNFGQRAFTYTNAGVDRPAADFLSLNTYNLTDPTIVDPSTVFDTKLWTADGSSDAITGLAFEPSLVWAKSRSEGWSHTLYDAIRTAGANKALQSNSANTSASDNATYDYLSAFTSDGFSYTAGSTTAYFAKNTHKYVAWNWDAGSSTVTNNAGSIQSEVRANTTAGFSIVSFDSGTAGQQTIGHGLNSSPKLILCKNRDSANNWSVYHSDLGADSTLWLNKNFDVDTSYADIWGTSEPTSDVFGFKSGTNANADENCIAYCWQEVPGYSKIGSWVSTGDDFIYLGFKPAFLLAKASSKQGNWAMYDLLRMVQGSDSNMLLADSSTWEEDTGAPNYNNYAGSEALVDLLSNGFKIRHGGSSPLGDSGETYIYAAFAESPFKYANAR